MGACAWLFLASLLPLQRCLHSSAKQDCEKHLVHNLTETKKAYQALGGDGFQHASLYQRKVYLTEEWTEFPNLETEPLFNITNGVVTWAAIISSSAANTIFIRTATIYEADIIEVKKATTSLIIWTIGEVSTFTW